MLKKATRFRRKIDRGISLYYFNSQLYLLNLSLTKLETTRSKFFQRSKGVEISK